MNKTILLLGASNDANGELSQMAIDRLECAYSIYANNSDISFLCTGGFGEHFNTTQMPHAEYLRQWLLLKGVKNEDFLPHIISSNTYEDIHKLKGVINSMPIDLLIVVTSDFHVERVRMLYEMFIRHENVIFIPATSALSNNELHARMAHEEKAIQFLKNQICIRQATFDDILELKNLYQGTVLTINRLDYSQEEVDDWASCGDDLSHIRKMIETHYFIVAVNQLSQIVGFSSITPQGYLHSMFVHKDFQGKGIATLLLKEIERYAMESKMVRITSEVSITARPFFEKWGYTVEIEQKRKANQLCLTNYRMAKELI